ncbi:MAG: adenylate/guanylate cyclase domain-containing protein, partial [Candidatus Riflebacteria bacterium]
MLESMSNGLITLDANDKIATCNAACSRILKVQPDSLFNKNACDFFTGENEWIMEKLRRVKETQKQQTSVDAPLKVREETLSVNLTVQSLLNIDQKRIGSMIIIEDISNEKRLKSTMSRYMDPGIADRLLASGTEILGGTNVECTVLFSDIRGFTPLTEQLGPQGTVALLNEYFSLMVDCIQHESGMLDKFIGDAIMAAFGIPVAHEDDADRSVRAAVAMIEKLQHWNRSRIAAGRLPVNIGIGLNTDLVVSGNIGSSKRMDFTIIGDGVNLASRLESACKKYGARILISEFTQKKLQGTYRQREIDRVVVKGKTQPVAIYEILAYHTPETFPGIGEVLGLFKDGLSAYRARKWDAAIRLFQDCLKINPEDRPSALYIERSQYLKTTPPPEDWSGIWIMDSK